MQGIISSNASVIVQSGNNYAEKLWVDISSMDGTFLIQTNVPTRYVSVEYQVTTSLQNRKADDMQPIFEHSIQYNR